MGCSISLAMTMSSSPGDLQQVQQLYFLRINVCLICKPRCHLLRIGSRTKAHRLVYLSLMRGASYPARRALRGLRPADFEADILVDFLDLLDFLDFLDFRSNDNVGRLAASPTWLICSLFPRCQYMAHFRISRSHLLRSCSRTVPRY